MILDLSEILKSEGAHIDINYAFNFESFEYQGETYVFEHPVKIKGQAVNTGDIINLDVVVAGEIKVNCYRCLKPVIKTFSFDMNEKLTQKDWIDMDDDDIVYFKGNRIDLSEIIMNNIIINMDMKYLCSADCKGICPKCGQDLNTATCECDNQDIDIRLEVLKKY